MKNLPYFFLVAILLVGGLVTYSNQSTTDTITFTPLQLPKKSTDTLHSLTSSIEDTLVLDKESQTVFAQYNLSRLWTSSNSLHLSSTHIPATIWFVEMEVAKAEEAVEPVTRVNEKDTVHNDTVHIDDDNDSIRIETMEVETEKKDFSREKQPEIQSVVYNGFYGTDHYRIEMYFASVTKDAQKPNVYHVKGKSRFKKNVKPFTGTITLYEAEPLHDKSVSKKELKARKISQLYASSGTFEFTEDSTYSNAGVFRGKVYVNFASYTDRTSRLWFFSEKGKTRGAGFLFDGEWANYKTGKTKPILLPSDIFMIANSLLTDFKIGGRGVEINPKYRKLGWDSFWQNEEWWNEPAKTAL
jgi:hypothetical protein